MDFPLSGVTGDARREFHLFAPLTAPGLAPIVTSLVSYGHLLIGLSLLAGLYVRVTAGFAALLLLLYWLGSMDWPYIENRFNFILNQHIVYAAICANLALQGAGRIFGLDAGLARPRLSAAPA